MMDLTTVLLVALVALLLGGVAGAVIVAAAARGRYLDETDAAARAWRDLLDLAHRLVDPYHRAELRSRADRIWTCWQPGGSALPDPVPPRAPAYVHRILDAWTGGPLDFGGCAVPPDVQGRIRAILSGRTEPATGQPGARDG